MTTVQGVYRQGRVELSRQPAGIEESNVLVVFLPESAPAQDESRQGIIQRILARAAQGLNLGGGPYPKREELSGASSPGSVTSWSIRTCSCSPRSPRPGQATYRLSGCR